MSKCPSRDGRDTPHDHFVRPRSPGTANAISVSVGYEKIVRSIRDAIQVGMHGIVGCVRRTTNDGTRTALVGQFPCRLGCIIVRLEFDLDSHTSIGTWCGRGCWCQCRGTRRGACGKVIDGRQCPTERKRCGVIDDGIPDLSGSPGWICGANGRGNSSNICVIVGGGCKGNERKQSV